MISHLDKTLEALLRQKVPLSPESYDISFDIPIMDWTRKLSGDKRTVNLYLYDIRENQKLRTNEWQLKRNPDSTVTRKKPSIRIDLSYLITAWSPAQTEPVVEEHHMLSQILATLFKYPTIPPDVLQGNLATIVPPPEIPALVAQPNGFKDQGQGPFWNAAGQHWKPAVQYTVTIPLDLQEAITGAMVTTKIHKYQQEGHPETEEKLLQIGGRVVEAADPATGIPGAEVIILELGRTTRSDINGYYTFVKLQGGTYTVKAGIEGRKTERTVQVPAPGGNYNIMLSKGK